MLPSCITAAMLQMAVNNETCRVACILDRENNYYTGHYSERHKDCVCNKHKPRPQKRNNDFKPPVGSDGHITVEESPNIKESWHPPEEPMFE